MIDLALSRRVQSKRVEHAVLIFLMERYAGLGASDFEISYRATERNAPIAQVFWCFACKEAFRQGADFIYHYDISKKLPEKVAVAVTYSKSAKQLEPAHVGAPVAGDP